MEKLGYLSRMGGESFGEELSLSKHGPLLASWAGDGGARHLARPRSPMTSLAHCRRTHPLGFHSKKSQLGPTVQEAGIGFLIARGLGEDEEHSLQGHILVP